MEIKVMQNLYAANEQVAHENQKTFLGEGIFTVNLLGSPGAGKTALLEKILGPLSTRLRTAVIEGDIATARDAKRIAASGVPVIQINTNGGCHLDAPMIAKVLPGFHLAEIDLMIIENVGNLVCPAAFSLGEDIKIVVLSVAEGGDKPAKYPRAFLEAGAVVVNKIDLLPFSDVNLEELTEEIRKINPRIEIFPLSCRLQAGMEPFIDWLAARVGEKAHV